MRERRSTACGKREPLSCMPTRPPVRSSINIASPRRAKATPVQSIGRARCANALSRNPVAHIETTSCASCTSGHGGAQPFSRVLRPLRPSPRSHRRPGRTSVTHAPASGAVVGEDGARPCGDDQAKRTAKGLHARRRCHRLQPAPRHSHGNECRRHDG